MGHIFKYLIKRLKKGDFLKNTVEKVGSFRNNPSIENVSDKESNDNSRDNPHPGDVFADEHFDWRTGEMFRKGK